MPKFGSKIDVAGKVFDLKRQNVATINDMLALVVPRGYKTFCDELDAWYEYMGDNYETDPITGKWRSSSVLVKFKTELPKTISREGMFVMAGYVMPVTEVFTEMPEIYITEEDQEEYMSNGYSNEVDNNGDPVYRAIQLSSTAYLCTYFINSTTEDRVLVVMMSIPFTVTDDYDMSISDASNFYFIPPIEPESVEDKSIYFVNHVEDSMYITTEITNDLPKWKQIYAKVTFTTSLESFDVITDSITLQNSLETISDVGYYNFVVYKNENSFVIYLQNPQNKNQIRLVDNITLVKAKATGDEFEFHIVDPITDERIELDKTKNYLYVDGTDFNNLYDEYVFINGSFEKIAPTNVETKTHSDNIIVHKVKSNLLYSNCEIKDYETFSNAEEEKKEYEVDITNRCEYQPYDSEATYYNRVDDWLIQFSTPKYKTKYVVFAAEGDTQVYLKLYNENSAIYKKIHDIKLNRTYGNEPDVPLWLSFNNQTNHGPIENTYVNFALELTDTKIYKADITYKKYTLGTNAEIVFDNSKNNFLQHMIDINENNTSKDQQSINDTIANSAFVMSNWGKLQISQDEGWIDDHFARIYKDDIGNELWDGAVIAGAAFLKDDIKQVTWTKPQLGSLDSQDEEAATWNYIGDKYVFTNDDEDLVIGITVLWKGNNVILWYYKEMDSLGNEENYEVTNPPEVKFYQFMPNIAGKIIQKLLNSQNS